MRDNIGIPTGGFPAPLRTKILKGLKPVEGRPGAELLPLNFGKLKAEDHPGEGQQCRGDQQHQDRQEPRGLDRLALKEGDKVAKGKAGGYDKCHEDGDGGAGPISTE